MQQGEGYAIRPTTFLCRTAQNITKEQLQQETREIQLCVVDTVGIHQCGEPLLVVVAIAAVLAIQDLCAAQVRTYSVCVVSTYTASHPVSWVAYISSGAAPSTRLRALPKNTRLNLL